jgi:hypothetical protein
LSTRHVHFRCRFCWIFAPCDSAKFYQNFADTYCIHFYGHILWRWRQHVATKRKTATDIPRNVVPRFCGWKSSLYFLFCPDDGSSKFLRNVRIHLPDSIQENSNLQSRYLIFFELTWSAYSNRLHIASCVLTELSPYRGAASCAGTQELASILRNPMVQYRVHKSPPLVPLLSHINPIRTISFNIVHPLTSWSSQWSLSFWLSH